MKKLNPVCKSSLAKWALLNFIIMAAAGTLLRYMQVFPAGELNYMFILHSHSHFAFAGWMFLSLAVIIMHHLYGEEWLSQRFQKIVWLTFICSFGMLISFAFQGYKAVSIGFSTLFIAVTYWFGYSIYGNQKLKEDMLSGWLIKGGLVFLCLSSLGPLALGPIMASGVERGSPLYQNSIYFYLHFQLNGWMQMAALAMVASTCLKPTVLKDVSFPRQWLLVFILSTLPLFGIFTLWARPPQWIHWIAFGGAFLHMVSWFIIVKRFSGYFQSSSLLVKVSLIALSLKLVLQVLICVPFIGEWVFGNRHLIIGYVHLITLACISPIIIDQFVRRGFLSSRRLSTIHIFYIGVVTLYLLLLFSQPLLAYFDLILPHFQFCLLLVSALFVIAGIIYYRKC